MVQKEAGIPSEEMKKGVEIMVQKEAGVELLRSKRSISPRIFILAGVVSPILYVLVFTIEGLLRPGYSPIHQTISALAVGPNAWMQKTNAVVCGLLLITFAIGFYQMMRPVMSRRWLMISAILLVIAGIGLTSSGFFIGSAVSTNPADIYVAIHNYCFLAIFYSLMTVFFIVGRQLWKNPSWRRYGWYSIITGFATLVGYGVIVYAAHFAPPMVGILERFMFVEAFAWHVVIGYRFLTL